MSDGGVDKGRFEERRDIMKTKLTFPRIFFAMCIILSGVLRAYAVPLNWRPNRNALTGIKSFALEEVVVCEYPGTTLDEHTQEKEELIRHIKATLRASGIEVFDMVGAEVEEDEIRKGIEADAKLHIRITDILPVKIGVEGFDLDRCIYFVTIYVVDWVSTDKDSDIRFPAIIWADCWGETSRPSLLQFEVNNTLNTMLDKLIKDYLQARIEQLKSVPSKQSEESRDIPEERGQIGTDWTRAGYPAVSLLMLGVVVMWRLRKKKV